MGDSDVASGARRTGAGTRPPDADNAGKMGVWIPGPEMSSGPAHLEGQESLTGSGAIVGTPLYMSPEQAGARKISIDHRTDIYSLGATLYELLTLQPPLKGKDHQETLSQIISKDPEPLRKRNPRVPRDLETVVLKCLRKEPRDRYGTAEALAQDLRRFVRGDPIEARPQTARERWAGRLRRNRKAVLAVSGLLLAALAALVSGSLVLLEERSQTKAALHDASFQRQKADRNFERARRAVDEMLTDVGQSELASLPGFELVRCSLLEKALAFYGEFLQEQGAVPSLGHETARANLRLADILGMLGRQGEAEKVYRQALATFEKLLGEDPGELTYRDGLAECQTKLGVLLSKTGRKDAAKAALRAAIGLFEPPPDAVRDDKTALETLATSEHHMATLLEEDGDHKAAEQGYRRAIELRDQILQRDARHPACRKAQAESLKGLAGLLRRTGDLEGAEKAYRRAIDLHEGVDDASKAKPENLHALADARLRLAALLSETGRADASLAECRTALAVCKKLASDFPHVPDYRAKLAQAQSLLAGLLRTAPEGPSAAYEEAIRVARKLAEDYPDVPDYRRSLGLILNGYGGWLCQVGRGEEGHATYAEVVKIFEELSAAFPSRPEFRNQLAMFKNNVGTRLLVEGKTEEAEQEFRYARDVLEALCREYPEVPEYPSNLAQIQNNMAHLLVHGRKFNEAAESAREAVRLQEGLVKRFPEVTAYRQVLMKNLINLGEAHFKTGKPDEAAPSFERALGLVSKQMEAEPDAPGPAEDSISFRVRLANCRWAAGRYPDALQMLEAAIGEERRLMERFPAKPSYQAQLVTCQFRLALLWTGIREAGKATLAMAPAESALSKELLSAAPAGEQVLGGLIEAESDVALPLANAHRFDEAMSVSRKAAALGLAAILCAGLFPPPASADGNVPPIEWERVYGEVGSEAQAVLEIDDGGYIVAGYGLWGGFLMETDPEGQIQWVQKYASLPGVKLVARTPDGFVIHNATALGKTDELGNLQSVQTFAGIDAFYSWQQTADGGFIGVGTVRLPSDNLDLLLLKVDKDFKEEWRGTFGGPHTDDGLSVLETRDGNYIAAGETTSFGAGGWDAYVVKTDAQGHQIWAKTFGGAEDDSAHSILENDDGDFVACGHSYVGGNRNVWIFVMDKDGRKKKEQRYGGTAEEECGGARLTADGGYIISATTQSFGAGDYDIWVLKVRKDLGTPVWSTTLGGPSADNNSYYNGAPLQTRDGGYIVFGLSCSFGDRGDGDAYLVKLGPESTPGAFVRGETDGDGLVSITDAICILLSLFDAARATCSESIALCWDAADANDDGRFDLSDAVTILGHLFAGAGPLPEPFGKCAGDPTADSLGCIRSSRCQ